MTGFCDAHNHLQDERFGGCQEELLRVSEEAEVTRWVVNGACESDWHSVARLATQHPGIVPAFGYHPWYLHERTADWQETLTRWLNETPRAVIGEIGLDRWLIEQSPAQRSRYVAAFASREPASVEEQTGAFTWQWQLAAKRGLSASVHCLKAWGRLKEIIEAGPRLERGFLLHSFGGPAELVEPFVRLGAYFGFPGYFLHERKARQREVFRTVPLDRLLIETDAPDQCLPDQLNQYPLTDPATGRGLNHPANLPVIYAELASWLELPISDLRDRVAENFSQLFVS